MSNELVLNEQALDFQVSFTQGSVEIVGYNEIHKSLSQLSDYLNTINITEENIKESKKLVARVSKATKEMNQARIENKKRFMQPFDTYESQVKTLTALVKEAEETVRSQIRELEEAQREEKEQKIRELFDKRKEAYQYNRFFTFEDFLEPRHLNKSTPINTVEIEMAQWLKATDDDIKTLDSLAQQGNFDFPEAMHDYMQHHSVSHAVNHLLKKQVEQAEVERKLVESKKNPSRGNRTEFINVIMKKDDFKRVEPILEGMGVYYSCA